MNCNNCTKCDFSKGRICLCECHPPLRDEISALQALVDEMEKALKYAAEFTTSLEFNLQNTGMLEELKNVLTKIQEARRK